MLKPNGFYYANLVFPMSKFRPENLSQLFLEQAPSTESRATGYLLHNVYALLSLLPGPFIFIVFGILY